MLEKERTLKHLQDLSGKTRLLLRVLLLRRAS